MVKLAQQQSHKTKVKRRSEDTHKRIKTAIWHETASADNPYLSESCRCHGYDLLELMKTCRYSEVLFLMFRGEFPDKDQLELFEQLQIAMISPGVRHPAVRATVNAATSRSDASNILPIGLSVLSGQHLGAAEVEQAMLFLKKESESPIKQVMEQLILPMTNTTPVVGDSHPIPGFGSRFGSIDPMACHLANQLYTLEGAGNHLKWGAMLVKELAAYNIAWLIPGVVAATLLDLGFHPRTGAGMYQLFSAPGLLAHAWEYAEQPFNSLPFADDSQYIVETADETI